MHGRFVARLLPNPRALAARPSAARRQTAPDGAVDESRFVEVWEAADWAADRVRRHCSAWSRQLQTTGSAWSPRSLTRSGSTWRHIRSREDRIS